KIARFGLAQHYRPPGSIAAASALRNEHHPVHAEFVGHMPTRGEKKVLASGIVTWPPSASAANFLSASASSFAAIDSAKPSNFGLPVLRPSDDMIVVSPT